MEILLQVISLCNLVGLLPLLLSLLEKSVINFTCLCPQVVILPQRRDCIITIGKLCGYYMYSGHVQGGGDLNCFNLYRIEASPSNQGTPVTQGPMIPTVSGQGEDISVSVTSGLVRNTVYSVSIVSINVNGENSSMGDIQFSE